MDEAKCSANCGKDFEDSEQIIGITTAIVSNEDDAIVPDDQPWIDLYHKQCWKGAVIIGVKSNASSDKADDSGQSG